MKKSILVSVIVVLLLCISPIYAGGGPPSPTEVTRPADGTPDDTNEGTGWDDPDEVSPDEFDENILQYEVIINDKDDLGLVECIVTFIIPLISLEPIEGE